MFPLIGFYIYKSPSYSAGEYLDVNPLTKSLANQSFVLKEICKDGFFVKGNFREKQYHTDFYLELEDIKYRNFIEFILISVFCIIPMIIHTAITKPTATRQLK